MKQHLKCPCCGSVLDFGSAQRKFVRCPCGGLLFGAEFKERGFATLCEEKKAKVAKLGQLMARKTKPFPDREQQARLLVDEWLAVSTAHVLHRYSNGTFALSSMDGGGPETGYQSVLLTCADGSTYTELLENLNSRSGGSFATFEEWRDYMNRRYG